MSTSSPSAPSSIPARKSRGIKLWRSNPTSPVPSQPATDWLAPYLVTAKAITAAGEMVPFPYLKGVFGTAVLVLETIQKVKKNRDNMKDLCGNIVQIMNIMHGHLLSQKETDTSKLEILCKDLESVFQGVLSALEKLLNKPKGFRGHFNEAMQSDSVGDIINGYKDKIQELRQNFMLIAQLDTNRQVHRLGDALIHIPWETGDSGQYAAILQSGLAETA
ncbi:hypothetical protein GGX14DRAFT_136460 [Mycena pura]|uniref:Uncharacterized protein n=1 Tax=Mycena pura TaxID=153505 RepID=A0AAD6VBS6_9AGAR|nr:hypothetical protein GGX14DRAFT_136460 [Mycena pura]